MGALDLKAIFEHVKEAFWSCDGVLSYFLNKWHHWPQTERVQVSTCWTLDLLGRRLSAELVKCDRTTSRRWFSYCSTLSSCCWMLTCYICVSTVFLYVCEASWRRMSVCTDVLYKQNAYHPCFHVLLLSINTNRTNTFKKNYILSICPFVWWSHHSWMDFYLNYINIQVTLNPRHKTAKDLRINRRCIVWSPLTRANKRKI